MKTIITGIILIAIAGLMWGGREAYHADSLVFEKALNVSPKSFFGSRAWERNYVGNTWPNPHKPEIWNTFRDWWHFSGFFSRLLLVIGVVLIIWDRIKGRIAYLIGALASFPIMSFIIYGVLRRRGGRKR